MTTPLVLQPRLYEAGWWPCDRCGGTLPGADPKGQEVPGAPVKLTEDGYRCGPCRGLPQPLPRKLTTRFGQAAMQRVPQTTPIRRHPKAA